MRLSSLLSTKIYSVQLGFSRAFLKVSVAKRGEFSRFVGFLAQKGGQIFEDGDLWELFKKGGILKNFTKIGKFSYFSTKC